MTNQNICCNSALASSVLADAKSYFWIDLLQGESVAESSSIISHYFRTYFSLYVVPRGSTVMKEVQSNEWVTQVTRTVTKGVHGLET